jgi:hypothetical protein
LAKNSKVAAAIICVSITFAACGPPRVTLPTGAGTSITDYLPALTSARAACESVRTFQAELGLSGRAAGQRMRGRIHAGLVPEALRLEGVAPFGGPVFILVADGARGTLLLLRDRRVLKDAPPEEILNALVGIRLGPDDLRALLTGCVKAAGEPSAARSYGPDWMAVDLTDGGTIYLRRRQNDWQIVAGRYGGLEVDYAAFLNGRPSQVVIRGKDLDLMLALDQIALNVELPLGELVAVNIPAGTSPITLEELRRAGPLGQ